jgi:creatinine amidohydrolase
MKRFCLLIGMLVISLPAFAQISFAQSSSVWIDDHTWPEVRDAIAAGKRTAIIYTGSSEQNGPHMVIGKHNILANYMAQRIAEELGDALVYPVIPFAVTGNPTPPRSGHMRFPGSVTVPPEIFLGVVRGVAQSALTAGFKVVALMGDHGGGQEELALAAKTMDAQARQEGARVLFIGDVYAKSRKDTVDLLAKRGLPTNEEHAGIEDTSPMLYLEGQSQGRRLIRKDRLAEGDEKSGVRGHPALSSAEIGKVILDLRTENAVKQIRALLASAK